MAASKRPAAILVSATGYLGTYALLGLSPWPDEFFRFDPQSVGNTGDVIEIANHLGSVMNCAIVEPLGTQRREIVRAEVVLV